MTAITDCHCGNCTVEECELSNQKLEYAQKHEILSVGRIMMMRCTTELKGCMLHPKAREVLMKGVIKELEALEAKTNSNDIVACGYRTGLYKAISLIRGGDGEC